MITSILDQDFYKFLLQKVLFQNRGGFGQVEVKYKMTNRGRHLDLSKLRKVVDETFPRFRLKPIEREFLSKIKPDGVYCFDNQYLDWLESFCFNPTDVVIDGDNLFINGPWLNTTLWEVPLMAIISELNNAGEDIESPADIRKKWLGLPMPWADFGTRRRHSFKRHAKTIAGICDIPEFVGTSNMHFARMYDLQVIGTMPHEGIMGMSVFMGEDKANEMWFNFWNKTYPFNLKIFLPDTYTTDKYLANVSDEELKYWDGFRQDSGDPFSFVEKMAIKLWDKGIRSSKKKIIFSDSLNKEKLIKLSGIIKKYSFQYSAGIGTALTHDVGTPPNFVIKLCEVNGKRVRKLSDDPGKITI